MRRESIVILGLSITSSWGNGHATTYRALVRELARRGHELLFLERDVPWYATHRDLPSPPWGRTFLYTSLQELHERFTGAVRQADLVIVGSYVPQGVAVASWVLDTAQGITAFYDIDTPVTMAKLAVGDHEYLSPELIPGFDLYLSFTGGPTLQRLQQELRAQRPRPFYCSVDPELYYPQPTATDWDLGYLGTYSPDRQPGLERLLLQVAKSWPQGRFTVAGPQFPASVVWPPNVDRIDHLPPARHRSFYNAQRFTLNLTRADMVEAGWSPSVRLFEAAACGVPIISDGWPGLDQLFVPGEEILIPASGEELCGWLLEMPEEQSVAIGLAGRRRILAAHTAAHRAAELESHLEECRWRPSEPATAAPVLNPFSRP
ncbi:MAG: glycosyltransferase [Desulfuromonadales bacterium]|nr:glycosyltransferase [Desulfuromonadales bacterium]